MKETSPNKTRGKKPAPEKAIIEKADASVSATDCGFDSEIVKMIRSMAVAGLNPESALDLLAGLMAEVPAASKECMDKIRMIDGLIKTSRSMMEIKIKNDEVLVMMDRLDRLEAQIERVAADKRGRPRRIREVWNKPE